MTIAALSEGIHMTCPWRTSPCWDTYFLFLSMTKDMFPVQGFRGSVCLSRTRRAQVDFLFLDLDSEKAFPVSASFWVHNLQTAS